MKALADTNHEFSAAITSFSESRRQLMHLADEPHITHFDTITAYNYRSHFDCYDCFRNLPRAQFDHFRSMEADLLALAQVQDLDENISLNPPFAKEIRETWPQVFRYCSHPDWANSLTTIARPSTYDLRYARSEIFPVPIPLRRSPRNHARSEVWGHSSLKRRFVSVYVYCSRCKTITDVEHRGRRNTRRIAELNAVVSHGMCYACFCVAKDTGTLAVQRNNAWRDVVNDNGVTATKIVRCQSIDDDLSYMDRGWLPQNLLRGAE